MKDTLRIDHLAEVKTVVPGIEINFSFSNMEYLLYQKESPFQRQPIPIHNFPGDARIGSRHLLETLSRREAVPPENIFLSAGASMANYIICASLLEPGDEVLVESPVYEPLRKVPQNMGASVRFFPREPADYSVNVVRIDESLSSRTRMIVLTDSHNPSGNQLSREVLDYLQSLARARGIHILIDEVFSRFFRRQSLFVDYPEFIVTSSLSKFYGLGSLRVGWAFAPVAIVERARDFNDFLVPELPFPSLYLAHLLLSAPQIAEWEKRIAERVRLNREIVSEYLNRTNFLTTYWPRHGTLFFPEFKDGIDPERFYDVLRNKYKMLVTRGALFQMPRHFRFAAIWSPEVMREGLRRLEAALAETAGRWPRS